MQCTAICNSYSFKGNDSVKIVLLSSNKESKNESQQMSHLGPFTINYSMDTFLTVNAYLLLLRINISQPI